MPILRMWVAPQVLPPGRIDLFGAGLATAEQVHWTDGGIVPEHMDLLSLEVSGEDIEADFSRQWKQMHAVVQLHAVARLSPVKIVSSRIEPQSVVLGKACKCIHYPGEPPAVSMMSMPFGYPHATRYVLPKSDQPSDQVRNAIGWVPKAMGEPRIFERIMFLWIALEGLAPEVRRRPECEKCRSPLTCPKCGVAAETYRVIKALEAYLHGTLMVERKRVKAMYEVRSAIVHGRMKLDQSGADRAGAQYVELLQVALRALKYELKWPTDEPPAINNDGMMGNSLVTRGEMEFHTEGGRRLPLGIELTQVRATMLGNFMLVHP